MYIISGRGRKSGVARATGATASLAPMPIQNVFELSVEPTYSYRLLKIFFLRFNRYMEIFSNKTVVI